MINFWKHVQYLLACVVIASASQNAAGGSLLSDIDRFLSGDFPVAPGAGPPVATAYLSLYDPSGMIIDRQSIDAAGFLSAGYVNTGTEILFNGSLTFPDLYPLVSGGSGGFLATVHDFSIDIDAIYNSSSDLVSMQIDWPIVTQSFSETWNLSYGEDPVLTHFIYDGSLPQALSSGSGREASSYGSASFSLWLSTGSAPAAVPLPASVWLFVSGLLGLVGITRHKRS